MSSRLDVTILDNLLLMLDGDGCDGSLKFTSEGITYYSHQYHSTTLLSWIDVPCNGQIGEYVEWFNCVDKYGMKRLPANDSGFKIIRFDQNSIEMYHDGGYSLYMHHYSGPIIRAYLKKLTNGWFQIEKNWDILKY